MRLCKVPGTRHKFSNSYLFFLIRGMSGDTGMLDLMFAFKKLWGSLVESVREVLPTEESPECCVSTEKWHLIKSRKKERGSVRKCHRDSETPVLYNRQERLGKKIRTGGNNIGEDMGELHMGWHGWSKDWRMSLVGQRGRQSPGGHAS